MSAAEVKSESKPPVSLGCVTIDHSSVEIGGKYKIYETGMTPVQKKKIVFTVLAVAALVLSILAFIAVFLFSIEWLALPALLFLILAVGFTIWVRTVKDYNDPKEWNSYHEQMKKDKFTDLVKKHSVDAVISYKLLGDQNRAVYASYVELVGAYAQLESDYKLAKDRVRLDYASKVAPLAQREREAAVALQHSVATNRKNKGVGALIHTVAFTLPRVNDLSAARRNLGAAERVYGMDRNAALATIESQMERAKANIDRLYTEIQPR